jgi:hypothetical protein
VSSNASVKSSKSEQSRRRTKTAVRFAVDENDIIKTDVHEYEKMNEDEASLCFTTKTQVKEQKKLVAKEASGYARDHVDFVDRLEALFNSPLMAGSPGPAMDERKVIDLIFQIGESEARGYECRMCPLILTHKQWAMKTILRRQAQLKKDGVCSSSLSELLRTCCEQVNRNARDVAIKYAMADDVEAQKVYDAT